MGKPTDDLEQIRKLPCQNVSGQDIPAFAALRIVESDTNTGVLQVDQPSGDGADVHVLAMESGIKAGDNGQCTTDGPWYALYETGDGMPTTGQIWGPGNGTFTLRKGRPGYQIVGGALNGRVLVTGVASKIGDPFLAQIFDAMVGRLGEKIYSFIYIDTFSNEVNFNDPYQDHGGSLLGSFVQPFHAIEMNGYNDCVLIPPESYVWMIPVTNSGTETDLGSIQPGLLVPVYFTGGVVGFRAGDKLTLRETVPGRDGTQTEVSIVASVDLFAQTVILKSVVNRYKRLAATFAITLYFFDGLRKNMAFKAVIDGIPDGTRVYYAWQEVVTGFETGPFRRFQGRSSTGLPNDPRKTRVFLPYRYYQDGGAQFYSPEPISRRANQGIIGQEVDMWSWDGINFWFHPPVMGFDSTFGIPIGDPLPTEICVRGAASLFRIHRGRIIDVFNDNAPPPPSGGGGHSSANMLAIEVFG